MLNSTQLSGTVNTFSSFDNTISAFALYPARTNTSVGTFTAAFISKRIAPFSSTPLGDTYSNTAFSFLPSIAPMVMSIGMPVLIRPTSVSSSLPTNSISPILATVAIVVPSLKLFDCITEFPTLIGISSIVPLMVERTRVLLNCALSLDTPSRVRLRLSLAAFSSSRLLLNCNCDFSYSSTEITFSL